MNTKHKLTECWLLLVVSKEEETVEVNSSARQDEAVYVYIWRSPEPLKLRDRRFRDLHTAPMLIN